MTMRGWVIRTARSRTSGENGGVRFVMGSISQDQEPPGNPGRFILVDGRGGRVHATLDSHPKAVVDPKIQPLPAARDTTPAQGR